MNIKNIVKSDKALDAIEFVVNKAERFNSDYFPFKIVLIGIYGSALREIEVGDFDFMLIIKKDDSKPLQEWKNFKEKLISSNNIFLELISKLNVEGYRASTDLIINKYYDELVRYGFKPIWIRNWIKWLRISDVKEGVDRGSSIPFFDIENIVSRYVKERWRGKRLDIQIFREKPPEDLAYITIWNIKEGGLEIGEEDVRNYYKAEYRNLYRVLQELAEALNDQSSKFIENVHPVLASTLQYSNMDNHLARKLRQYTMNKINKLYKISEEDEDKYPHVNSILRQAIKDISIATLIYEKLQNIRYLLKKSQESKNEDTEKIFNLIYKRIRRYRFRKKQIRKVFLEFLSV